MGVDEFNQEFFDEIDKIENLISQGSTFESILDSKDVKIIKIYGYAPNSESLTNDSLIYQNKSSKLDLIENGDNFLFYNIINMSTSQIQTFENWEDIPNINTNILRGIYGAGFEKPSPIQSKAIHPIINGRNIIAQAQSGTGKTCAFITGALHLINTSKNENQILILLPTRELSIQVYDVFTQLSKFTKNIKMAKLQLMKLLP